MTDLQYKTVAVHIARHCINHLNFIYNSEFMFDGFTLHLKVSYKAGPKFWKISSDKFRIERCDITECTRPVHFDPARLLHYLN